jgi:hypothetical protein
MDGTNIKNIEIYIQFLFRFYLFVQKFNLYFINFNHSSYDKLYIYFASSGRMLVVVM